MGCGAAGECRSPRVDDLPDPISLFISGFICAQATAGSPAGDWWNESRNLRLRFTQAGCGEWKGDGVGGTHGSWAIWGTIPASCTSFELLFGGPGTARCPLQPPLGGCGDALHADQRGDRPPPHGSGRRAVVAGGMRRGDGTESSRVVAAGE